MHSSRKHDSKQHVDAEYKSSWSKWGVHPSTWSLIEVHAQVIYIWFWFEHLWRMRWLSYGILLFNNLTYEVVIPAMLTSELSYLTSLHFTLNLDANENQVNPQPTKDSRLRIVHRPTWQQYQSKSIHPGPPKMAAGVPPIHIVLFVFKNQWNQ